MYNSIRKLDRVRASSRLGLGWSAACHLLLHPVKHTNLYIGLVLTSHSRLTFHGQIYLFVHTREQRRPSNKPFTVNIPRTNILVCTYKANPVKLERILTGERSCFGRSNLACLVVGVTKLEAEIKTQECSMVYIFSSFQLKSLGQTNLLVRRSLPCLYMCDGFLSSKPRLTFLLSGVRLTCLPNADRNSNGRIYLFVRTTDRFGGPTWPACVHAYVRTY